MADATSLRILIDTNVFIAAESEPDSIHANAALATRLYRAATELGHTLCLGLASGKTSSAMPMNYTNESVASNSRAITS